MAESNGEYPTVLGTDAVFKGELQFEKGVRLLGKFEGEITTKGQLLIADGAMLTGNVKAGNIRVDGNVKGNLNAGEKVQLTGSARVEGDLQASRLEVAEGAVLVGRCMVGVNGQGKQVTSVSKPVGEIKPVGQTEPDKTKGVAPATLGGKK